jgi:hypothetical protein
MLLSRIGEFASLKIQFALAFGAKPRRLAQLWFADLPGVNFLNLAAMAAAAPLFEVKALRGVDFVLQNSPTARKFLIETMPGGIALFDYNNDGLLDIFLVNRGRITESLHVPEDFDRSDPRYWNRLYRQNRDGSFADVTQAAGLANAGNGNYGMGVAVGDYDNDGFPDLYVTSYGKNILYHNNGDGTFTDVTTKAGVAAGGWSVSAGFFDYDNDCHLDLFVARVALAETSKPRSSVYNTPVENWEARCLKKVIENTRGVHVEVSPHGPQGGALCDGSRFAGQFGFQLQGLRKRRLD